MISFLFPSLLRCVVVVCPEAAAASFLFITPLRRSSSSSWLVVITASNAIQMRNSFFLHFFLFSFLNNRHKRIVFVRLERRRLVRH